MENGSDWFWTKRADSSLNELLSVSYTATRGVYTISSACAGHTTVSSTPVGSEAD